MDEYKMLREEILSSINSGQVYDNIIYIFTGTILAFALSSHNDNYLVCLTPLLIILPLALRTLSRHRSISQQAAYLYVFCEGKDKTPPYMWERRHREFDKQHGCSQLTYKFRYPFRFYLIVIVCGIAAWTKTTKTQIVPCTTHVSSFLWSWLMSSEGVVTVCSCFLTCFIIWLRCDCYTQFREKYIKQWEEIRNREESGD